MTPTEIRTLPEAFEARLRAELGQDTAMRMLEALRMAPPATPAVRLNRRKGALPGPDLCPEPVSWSGDCGFRLRTERPVFAFDPAWQAGLYYVQDASSMAISAVVRELVGKHFDPSAALRYLDACAAPGGKTIAAIDALPEGSIVVANEFDRRRAGILVENLEKWGYPAVAASCGDTAAFRKLPASFDIIAVDAPCSGEGMMRKEPEAIAQWSPGLVADCAALQREILENTWEALKPGGFLIFSTCTFGREENEDNVARAERALGARRIPLDCLKDAPGVLSHEPATYRFMPGFVDGEGLFIVVLHKPDDAPCGRPRPPKNHGKEKIDPAASKLCASALGPRFAPVVMPDGSFSAIPAGDASFFATLRAALDLRLCGVPLGATKGRDIVPAQGLALSAALRPEAFPIVGLSDPREAIAYLRGESLGHLPDGTPRGFVAPAWLGAPLGFVKNLGSRANNLFPAHLRLKTLPPEGWEPPRIVLNTSTTDPNSSQR
ncbi:MAG: hypothetical protein K2M06_03980 [Muribaculaceae bacterium]|nr:hypothetical protein [Muribaculaceae bacterium]